jgi:hypothetical protein
MLKTMLWIGVLTLLVAVANLVFVAPEIADAQYRLVALANGF